MIKEYFESSRNQVFFISAVILLSQGLCLLNDGVFWDDWCYFKEADLVLDHCRELGITMLGYFHYFVQSTSNPSITYRLVLCLSTLISSLALYGVLRRLDFLDKSHVLFLVIYFALFPVNNAKISGACTQYSICFALFFCAFYLLSIYSEKETWYVRLLSLVLFFLSFSTNSLVFFYGLVVPFLIYNNWKKDLSPWKNVKDTMVRFPDFIALPVVFWILKILFMSPIAEHHTYNSITPLNVLLTVYLFPKSFAVSFLHPIYFAAVEAINLYVVFLIILVILCLFTPRIQSVSVKKLFLLAISGVFLLYAGLFPYGAVGKFPINFDWEDRHQLLVPIGAAVFLFYSLELILFKLKDTLRIYVHWVFVSLFFVYSIGMYLEAQRDWFKQIGIMEHIKTNELIRNNTSFLVEDLSEDVNINNRTYRFYEYTSFFKYCFKEEKRLAIRKQEQADIQTYKPYLTSPLFALSNYELQAPSHLITIDVKKEFNLKETVHLLYQYYWNKEYFEKKIVDLVQMRVTPL